MSQRGNKERCLSEAVEGEIGELFVCENDERRSSFFFFVNELIRMGRKRSSRIRCRRFIARQTLFDVRFLTCLIFNGVWSGVEVNEGKGAG